MESVFDHWFQEQEQLSEIASPYISDLYLPAYVENKYLNVVRGLETYHRFFINSPQEMIRWTVIVHPYSLSSTRISPKQTETIL